MKAKEVVRIVSTDHCDIFHNLKMINHGGGDDLNIAHLQRVITETLSNVLNFIFCQEKINSRKFRSFFFVLSSKDIVHL